MDDERRDEVPRLEACCGELGLALQSAKNEDPLKTAFTVAIDARDGITTGISPAERAHTIQVAIAPEWRAPLRHSSPIRLDDLRH